MRKLEIVNMYQNNIIYKNKKNKLRRNTIIASVVFCLLLFGCCYVKVVGGSNATDWYNEVSGVYNPISKLYNEDNNLIFTNNQNVLITNGSFILPLVSSDIEIVNNQILINPIENIMVVAPCSGIVEEIGTTNDGKKYLKIKHTSKVYSVIENVDMFGIGQGNAVKQGTNIATAKTGKKITFSIFKNDQIVTNIKIVKNKIVWE